MIVQKCNCYYKAPTVPCFRDDTKHLDDCPAKDSGQKVGVNAAPMNPVEYALVIDYEERIDSMREPLFRLLQVVKDGAAAMREAIAMCDEAYESTGYVKVAKSSRQRIRLERAAAQWEAAALPGNVKPTTQTKSDATP